MPVPSGEKPTGGIATAQELWNNQIGKIGNANYSGD
jgi:hypothetical protein